MKVKRLVSAIAGVLCTGLVVASVAWALPATKVTIKAPTSAKPTLHGTVISKKMVCWNHRTIKVHKQQGSHQHPSTDPTVATTISFRADSHNFGAWKLSAAQEPHPGFYYAQAVKTTACRMGLSRTIHLVP
jgi:hypothetical protein